MTVSAAARGIRLQADDDVAITTADVAAGTPVDVGGGLVTVRQDVSRGHKLAVRDLAAGAPVRRYGSRASSGWGVRFKSAVADMIWPDWQ